MRKIFVFTNSRICTLLNMNKMWAISAIKREVCLEGKSTDNATGSSTASISTESTRSPLLTFMDEWLCVCYPRLCLHVLSDTVYQRIVNGGP